MGPRIPAQLIEALLRLDDPARPIAETYRLLGAEADLLGLTRPSYERVRELVHRSRRGTPRLTALQILMLLTTMPKGVEDGLRRMTCSVCAESPIGQASTSLAEHSSNSLLQARRVAASRPSRLEIDGEDATARCFAKAH